MTKLKARYTEMILQKIKFTIILNRLDIKATFVIKSNVSLHESKPVYPYIPTS